MYIELIYLMGETKSDFYQIKVKKINKSSSTN